MISLHNGYGLNLVNVYTFKKINKAIKLEHLHVFKT